VAGTGIENPAFCRQPRENGILQVVADLITRDFLVSIACRLIAGQIRLPVAVYEIRECNTVSGSGGTYDGS
jgi:hypothetical protein